MRYAADNRLVQTLYAFTTGAFRVPFYCVIAVAVVASLYFPVRDLYSAHRTSEILAKQIAIREQYNDSLKKEVDSYLSASGIEQAARKQGMVKEGEKTITVTGDGASDSSSPSETVTSTSVKKAEESVDQGKPWYYDVLDLVFFYNGASGQAVVSSGNGASGE